MPRSDPPDMEVDDAHAAPVAWLANRNAVIATSLSIWAFLCFVLWRQRGFKAGAWLGPLLFALSQTAAEGALAMCGYIAAYLLCVDDGRWVARISRALPFACIQSVDVVQKLRHRILGVVELRIETAGGSSTEASLVALTPEEAGRLRPMLLAEDETSSSESEPPALVALTPEPLTFTVVPPATGTLLGTVTLEGTEGTVTGAEVTAAGVLGDLLRMVAA